MRVKIAEQLENTNKTKDVRFLNQRRTISRQEIGSMRSLCPTAESINRPDVQPTRLHDRLRRPTS